MKNFLLYSFALLACVSLLPLAPKLFPPKTEETPRLIHLLETQTGEVRLLPLEDYVIGVLTEADYPCAGEALKAVAVAVRSSAAYCEQNRPVHPDAAACDDPACCAPFTTAHFSDPAVEAASETAGLLLTYHGEPAAALTFASGGKYTASSLSVYGVDVPYLSGVENVEENALTLRSWAEDDFLARVGMSADADSLFLAYDESGRVCAAQLGYHAEQISGEQLASALALPSCFFTLEQTEHTVTARCEGAGDGVGMSRNGASILAENGMDFREILAFYFPGTEIRENA